ncbi:MAG: hypothetical protein ACRC18_06620 [Cetobacterium sp.]
MEISFRFTYKNDEECVNHLMCLDSIFKNSVTSEDIECDDDEGIGCAKIPNIDDSVIIDLVAWYDEDIRIKIIADELMVSTDRMFTECGL